nr:protein EARLY RESPONSIVE TO DEHYDRATION 15-like [Ipomoea batatas]
MALVSGVRSTLNPNAPLFIPASVRALEDFSPEWWNLMNSATWYHDYWLSQQQGTEYDNNDVADLLPDTIDLDVDEDILNMEAQYEEFLQSTASEQTYQPSLAGVKAFPETGFNKHSDSLLRSMSFPNERRPKSPIEPPKYYEKPSKTVSPKWNTRIIQQPR